MARVLIVGAGVAGCTVAYTLAEHGALVTLLEKSDTIGGKVRTYGCKATDKCLIAVFALQTDYGVGWRSMRILP